MTNDAKTQNAERAGCADAAFITYAKVKERNATDLCDFSSEEAQERLTDLLADLRHLARREGWDFDKADHTADDHFKAEVGEESEEDGES